jgi:hypothetical protein
VRIWLVIRNDGYEAWTVIAAYTSQDAASKRADSENAAIPEDPSERFPNFYALSKAVEVDPAR